MNKGYGQYCPIAKAAEIIAERWTPLVMRELLCGSQHFNDILRGVPLMSPSLLSQRLKGLERSKVVERVADPEGQHVRYRLTQAGRELWPVIEQMGIWGQRWARKKVESQDQDPALLMWDIRRGLQVDPQPERRTVLRFEFTDVPSQIRFWWLVVEQGQVDLCLKPPGFEEDLFITCYIATLIAVWLGDMGIDEALKTGTLTLQGPRRNILYFRSWFALSPFAGVERPTATEH